jgi:hypothetical protein
MSDHIAPDAAIKFYQTLVQLLQGGDALIFCPAQNVRSVQIALVDGWAIRQQMVTEPTQESGSNVFNTLLQLAENA